MKNEENNKTHNLNNGWKKLCEVNENRTFLNSFKVKESQTELVLVQGNLIITAIIILFVLGSCLFAFGISFFFPAVGFEGFLDIFCCFLGLAGGGAMLCFGILLASHRNKITFSKCNSLASISYGFFPFDKFVTCPTYNLRVRLYQIDIHQATEFLNIGDSALSICHAQDDALELIISTNKHRDILSKAHEKITKLIGSEIIDDTWSEYELPEGKIIHFQKTPIVKDREYENYRIYIEMSPDVIVWRRRRKELWVWIVSVLIGSAFIPFPLVSEDMSEFIFISILALPLGLFMLSFGVYFLARYWKNRLIVIDKAHDTIQYRTTQRGFGNKKTICKISDLAFLQFCMWVEESTDISTNGVFELNGVDKNGVRFNLCNSKDGTRLFEDASQLSERLKKPLVDSVPWQ